MGNTEIVELEIGEGEIVYFETVIPKSATRSGKEKKVSTDGKQQAPEKKLKNIISVVKPVADTVFETLKEMNSPQEIGLEFGIKIGGKTGVVFASAESEVNFKVSLKWVNKNNDQ